MSLEVEITCGRCKSILGVTPKDVKSASHHDIDGYTDHWYYITCPVCKKEIRLDGNNSLIQAKEDAERYERERNDEMSRDY